jgi:hypothetical protein
LVAGQRVRQTDGRQPTWKRNAPDIGPAAKTFARLHALSLVAGEPGLKQPQASVIADTITNDPLRTRHTDSLRH